ncbi:MAG: hypothetical protein ACLTLQ_22175 [[Clostridium] scindens]
MGELGIGHRDGPNEVLTKDPSLMCEKAAAAIGFPGGHVEGFPDAIKQGFRQFYDSLSKEGDFSTPRSRTAWRRLGFAMQS